jgi:hypothetical protein
VTPFIGTGTGKQIAGPTVKVDVPIDQLRELIDAQTKKVTEAAGAYGKVIIGLGYAGIFAVWSATKGELGKWQLILSALFVTFSLLAFIGFEVVRMLTDGILIRDATHLIDLPEDKFAKAFSDFQTKDKRWRKFVEKGWLLTLWLTILPGFAGGMILLCAFAFRLWLMSQSR